jgi:AbrB family looped-hinge helix DNA binding protein
MVATLTRKGQITIPKRIRDTLGVEPGSAVEFDIDARGHIILRKAGEKPASPHHRRPDRFDAARGRATVKWRTDELIRLLRGDD